MPKATGRVLGDGNRFGDDLSMSNVARITYTRTIEKDHRVCALDRFSEIGRQLMTRNDGHVGRDIPA